MLNIPVDNCCGCTACYNICPSSAIQMLPDEEGFSYPRINREQCMSCGLCEQVCPIIHKPDLPDMYIDCVVAQSVVDEVLNDCTSGGFIDALYQYVLEHLAGYVVGVAFNAQLLPEHVITNSYEQAKKFRNSKYAQSELDTIFRDVRSLLAKGRTVAFVGTPCQVAGLKSFLRKDYTNLITVDLVCRSIPSPKLWRQYLDWQEERHKAKIKRVSCRKKTYGYHSGTLEIDFIGRKHYAGSNRVDYFMKSFHHDICSRKSCYNCAFKTKHRCSDYTVFDSWNPRQVAFSDIADNDRGFSNVIVHTEMGKEVLSKIQNINCYPADPERMFQFTGGMESKSISYKKERDTFYPDLNLHGFYKTARKYVPVTWIDRTIELMKPLRYFIITGFTGTKRREKR